MNRRQVWVAVVASVVLACGAWMPNLALAAEAPEPAKAPAPKPEEVQEAVKGFRGFLVGHVVSHNDTGIVLKVKAVTLIEGCQAKNPGILLGLETPVKLATEKGVAHVGGECD